MSKKQSDAVSKRKLRKEELRKKERQQRLITIVAILVIGITVLAIIIIPSLNRTPSNTAVDFIRATKRAYENANGTTIGDPNAKVKIDVFSDFECSACRTYSEAIEPEVIKQLVQTGQVYYIFHQYPFLDQGSADQTSHRAALASECAAEQNHFWDYKSMLYANLGQSADKFSEARLEAYAQYLKLDMDQYKACMSDKRYQNKLDEGLNLGDQMGVSGTPSVFANGVIISPGMVPTFDQILRAVQTASQGN